MQNVYNMIGGAGGIGNIISKFRKFDRNGDGQVKNFNYIFYNVSRNFMLYFLKD
jgi:hypothetical protein